VPETQPKPTRSFIYRLEHGSERFMFASRWLLAPVYVGMIVALIVIIVKFFFALVALVGIVFGVDIGNQLASHDDISSTDNIVLGVLALLDLALLANLVLIVIFAGYENFVSKIASARNAEDRPSWMGHVDFSGLKMKLIGSIVAISVIGLLHDFTQVEHEFDPEKIFWRIMLHLTFLLSGIGFAFMDWLGEHRLIVSRRTHSGG
jgi:uncharacterized protein (TIGR00645 family)